MIYSYNQAVGDVLLVVCGNPDGQEVASESRGNVTRVFVKETGTTVGLNVFAWKTLVPNFVGHGQVKLTAEELAILNETIQKAGFTEVCTVDETPKFVVGFVKSCKKHPDSDHLSITQIETGNGEVLPIVCGASNIKAGLKVVVAKVGAMMPNGLIIWPGKLRGADSHGMICSAKELQLADAPAKRGILELPFDAPVGAIFEPVTGNIQEA